MSIDVDTLPPTRYLILEVLAARHRLGEQLWTFPANIRPALGALADAGLVGWKGGITHGTVRAWLTDTGRTAVLDGSYTPPDEAAVRADERRRTADRLDRMAAQRLEESPAGTPGDLIAAGDAGVLRGVAKMLRSDEEVRP